MRDVIAGWGARPALPFSQWESTSAREFERAQNGEVEGETGAEREKRLRKLAQRGVVRLFNAIGAAQGAPLKAEKEEAKKRKREAGESDAGSTATTTVGIEGPGGKVLRRPNVLGGRGKGEARESVARLWTRPGANFLCSLQPLQGVFPGSHSRRAFLILP